MYFIYIYVYIYEAGTDTQTRARSCSWHLSGVSLVSLRCLWGVSALYEAGVDCWQTRALSCSLPPSPVFSPLASAACASTSAQKAQFLGGEKSVYIVTLHGKCTIALTFENGRQLAVLSPGPGNPSDFQVRALFEAKTWNELTSRPRLNLKWI